MSPYSFCFFEDAVFPSFCSQDTTCRNVFPLFYSMILLSMAYLSFVLHVFTLHINDYYLLLVKKSCSVINIVIASISFDIDTFYKNFIDFIYNLLLKNLASTHNYVFALFHNFGNSSQIWIVPKEWNHIVNPFFNPFWSYVIYF